MVSTIWSVAQLFWSSGPYQCQRCYSSVDGEQRGEPGILNLVAKRSTRHGLDPIIVI